MTYAVADEPFPVVANPTTLRADAEPFCPPWKKADQKRSALKIEAVAFVPGHVPKPTSCPAHSHDSSFVYAVSGESADPEAWLGVNVDPEAWLSGKTSWKRHTKMHQKCNQGERVLSLPSQATALYNNVPTSTSSPLPPPPAVALCNNVPTNVDPVLPISQTARWLRHESMTMEIS